MIKTVIHCEIHSAEDATEAITRWLETAPPMEKLKFAEWMRGFVEAINKQADTKENVDDQSNGS